MTQPVLYTFGLSVWAAVPELAIAELYPEGAIQKKILNLAEGENFAPWFLEINEKATLPTLVTDEETFTSTEAVTKWLVDHAPTKVKAGDYDFIRKIHEDAYDPNFAMLFARSHDELKTKAAGFPAIFAQNRQDALHRYSAEPAGAKFNSFYAEKKAGNGGLLGIYKGHAPAEAVQGFIDQSNQVWANIIHLITKELSTVPSTGFVGGERPGETDFHLGAYLARIAMTQGVTDLRDLQASLGTAVPENVLAYWNAWIERTSWKQVYAEGLH